MPLLLAIAVARGIMFFSRPSVWKNVRILWVQLLECWFRSLWLCSCQPNTNTPSTFLTPPLLWWRHLTWSCVIICWQSWHRLQSPDMMLHSSPTPSPCTRPSRVSHTLHLQSGYQLLILRKETSFEIWGSHCCPGSSLTSRKVYGKEAGKHETCTFYFSCFNNC